MLTDPTDKYCRLCGAYVEDGTYNPIISEWAYGIFGPPPIGFQPKRKHICYRCGFIFFTETLHDIYKFCPKCGGQAPTLSAQAESQHIQRYVCLFVDYIYYLKT